MEIKRPEPGEEPEQITLDVKDENSGTTISIDTVISPRKMTYEETMSCFDRAYDELLDILQKDNDSLDNIVMSIQFPDSLCNGIVNIHIYPEDYRIIDYDGTVYNENIGAGESVETALNYVMSYEDYTRNGVIDINVKSLGENPHSMLTTDKQTLKRIIDNALKENEDKAVIELPDTINNTSVTYAYVQSQTGSKNNLLFAAIIVIAVIVLIYYKKKTKAKEEQKLRQKQLQYDYSEVISKLTLLLGAGMTVRRAWETIICHPKTINNIIHIYDKSLKHFAIFPLYFAFPLIFSLNGEPSALQYIITVLSKCSGCSALYFILRFNF